MKPGRQQQSNLASDPDRGDSYAFVAPASALTIVNAASLLPGSIAPGMLVIVGGTGLTSADIGNTQILFGSLSPPILSANSTGLVVQVPTQIPSPGSIAIEVF